MFTKEELEYIKEELGEEWYEKALQVNRLAQEGITVKTELEENLRKIFLQPKAKKHFVEALKEAQIPVDIPSDPYYEKIEDLERNVSKVKEDLRLEAQKKEILDLLNQYGITPDEYDELIQFQKEYKIKDNKKAIELYALYRQKKLSELPPSRFVSEMIKGEGYTEEEAYKRALEDLRKIMQGGR